MFSAIFQHHVGYLVACTLTALVLGGTAWALARKLGRPHGIWWAALAFTVTGVLGVTFMGAGPASGECVLNHLFAEPFHTTQGVWNLAMMVPVGTFALLAVRRPLPVLVGIIAFPMAIEFTQATVDGLGRVCDSSDAEMNIIGGLVGFTVAGVVLAVRQSVDWQSGVKGALIAFVALVLVGTGVVKPMLSFTNVDGTGLSAASADQERAVKAVVNQAFGDRYTIGKIYEQPCGDTPCKHLLFSLYSRGKRHSDDFADASLSWPDKKHLNVHLEGSDRLTAMGFPVRGAKVPTTDREAQKVAQAYAQQRYPWARGATRQKTSAVGEEAALGWMTSWRWTYKGVLMPRMLDVHVDRGGRVSQIDVALGTTRADFPKLEVDARQARKAVDRAVAAILRANGNTGARFKSQAVTVQADDFDGTLKPYWLVDVTSYPTPANDDTQEPDPVNTYRVNAMSGQVYDVGGVPLKAN